MGTFDAIYLDYHFQLAIQRNGSEEENFPLAYTDFHFFFPFIFFVQAPAMSQRRTM